MTQCLAVAFTAKERAELIPFDPPSSPLQGDEVQGRTLFTLISPGTELANSALALGVDAQPEERFPKFPGYAAVFQVEARGAEVAGVNVGDVLFCMGEHRSLQRVSVPDTISVPQGLAPQVAVLARLMGVSMATLTTTTARPGDRVLVIGLGPIGYLCAQIFLRCGFEVCCCDPDPKRQDWARKGDLPLVFDQVPLEHPTPANTFALAIDCAGHEQAVLHACRMVKRGGEVVLVAVPWQRKTEVYAHALLNAVFRHYVVLRSGWEWQLPTRPSPHQLHSLMGNYHAAMRWLAQGSIYLKNLCRMVSPADCHIAYQRHKTRTADELFTIFDWQRIASPTAH